MTRLNQGWWAGFSGRAISFGLAWVMSALLVAALEVAVDPISAWETVLEVVFGLGVPWLGLVVALALYGQLANRDLATSLAARHGADRRKTLARSMVGSIALACFLICVSLVGCRQICHAAQEAVFTRDLLRCCGIGCLATIAYIALLLAATRIGFARAGAWVLFGVDLTLGHINAGWLMCLPHQNVSNLIGHPGFFLVSATASSWILLGSALGGVGIALAKTPR